MADKNVQLKSGVNNLFPRTKKGNITDLTSAPAASGGTDTSLVTTGEKHNWNNKQNALTAGSGISIASDTISVSGVPYLTTAPVADNTDGTLKFVVLTAEPATRYNGYVYLIVEPSVTLIDFAIDKTSYQAESGMTWGQWVNSAYNTAGATMDSTYIYAGEGVVLSSVAFPPAYVNPSDEIVQNYAYSTDLEPI